MGSASAVGFLVLRGALRFTGNNMTLYSFAETGHVFAYRI
jgi:hypothetical protein